MENERDEVFERIPWETIEKKGGDRQWIVYAIAGAVTLGALAYSFTRNQPLSPIVDAQAVPSTLVAAEVPATTTMSNMGSSAPVAASPVVVAEADLYAVEPERLAALAAAHAEWFAVEYMSVDGSEKSREVLASLLPEGVPTPEAPDGTQVFVDWAGARQVTPTGPTTFEVEVVVRSLASSGEAGFVRQPPRLVRVGVEIADDGQPHISGVPQLGTATPGENSAMVLAQVPPDVAASVADTYPDVIGGVQGADGSWEVVAMTTGPDGVKRPVTVSPAN